LPSIIFPIQFFNFEHMIENISYL